MRLIEYIAEVDGSQAAFARRADVPQRTINRLCRGEITVLADTALKILKATQDRPARGKVVSLDELVSERCSK